MTQQKEPKEPKDEWETFWSALKDAQELGSAVDAYFRFYGYGERDRDRMTDPDRVMWDALQKWRGLYR